MKFAATLVLLFGLLFAQLAQAAVTYVGATKRNEKNSQITLTMPAVAAFDVLLAQVSFTQTSETAGVSYKCANIAPPAGWAVLRCDDSSSPNNPVSQAIYWKYAVATDSGKKYIWKFATAKTHVAGGASAYRGADRTYPFDGHSGNIQYTTTTAKTFTASATSVSATVNGDHLAVFYAINFEGGGGNFTPPAGMTERYEASAPDGARSLTAQLSTAPQALAGATGNKTTTIKADKTTKFVSVSQLVAIKPPNAVDHIRIEHNATGVNCNPETITLKACVDAACTGLYTGTVSTTLAPSGGAATWGANPISFSGGSTSTTLKYTSAGTITLSASATSPVPLAAPGYRCFVGATETCNMTFASSGFVFSVPDLTACKTSASVTISALSGAGACTGSITGVQSVNFWSSYGDPASGAKQVSINGTAISGASPGTAINLTFDGKGVSSFTVNYADAGAMLLTANYKAGALTVTGSDSFVSVPDKLVVYSTASCAAGDASCPVFAKAGAPFTLNVKAACWQATPSSDPALIPATPNFQLAGISLSPSVVSPLGGADGALGIGMVDMVAANNGVLVIPDQTQSEVGVFTFMATPPDLGYFGLSVPGGTSANIGRFTPDHYALDSAVAPLLTNRSDRASCLDSFTYLDEAFQLDFSLLALNALGDATTNYDSSLGAFATLDPTKASSFGYGASTSALNLTSRLDLTQASSGSWSAGSATVSATLKLKRSAAPDGPFLSATIGVAPSDSDGVAFLGSDFNQDADLNGSMEHASLGTSNFRYGRLRLSNAYGSERLALPVATALQYWNQTAFVSSGDDTCSSIQASDVALSFPLSAGNLLAACETSSTVAAPLGLSLSAPGAGNSGWTDLTVNLAASATGNACVSGASQAATTANMPYLMWNWLGSGNQSPVARASFGIYKSPLIYRRENY